MPYSYATKNYDKEHMARTVGVALSISTKHAIEICSLLRHKPVSRAKDILRKAAEKKQAIPFTRFNHNVGHKKGIGPGRYAVKASQEILGLLESVEANAQFKGLNTSELVIDHICAQKAGKSIRHGRQRGITAKRTHVEIMVKETAKKESKKEAKPSKPKAEAPKQEAKAEKKEAKEEVKKEVKEEKKAEAKPAETKEAPAEKPKAEEKKEKPKEASISEKPKEDKK
jgi:large subunit ribosomal protein L22